MVLQPYGLSSNIVKVARSPDRAASGGNPKRSTRFFRGGKSWFLCLVAGIGVRDLPRGLLGLGVQVVDLHDLDHRSRISETVANPLLAMGPTDLTILSHIRYPEIFSVTRLLVWLFPRLLICHWKPLSRRPVFLRRSIQPVMHDTALCR